MGFFSLITGTDLAAGAHNAVLMQHAILGMKEDALVRLFAQLPESVASGSVGRNTDMAIDRIRRSSRPIQLNLMVIAMADLQWNPWIQGEKWMLIRNPFLALANTEKVWQRIDASSAFFNRKHGINIQVPRHPIDFSRGIEGMRN